MENKPSCYGKSAFLQLGNPFVEFIDEFLADHCRIPLSPLCRPAPIVVRHWSSSCSICPWSAGRIAVIWRRSGSPLSWCFALPSLFVFAWRLKLKCLMLFLFVWSYNVYFCYFFKMQTCFAKCNVIGSMVLIKFYYIYYI